MNDIVEQCITEQDTQVDQCIKPEITNHITYLLNKNTALSTHIFLPTTKNITDNRATDYVARQKAAEQPKKPKIRVLRRGTKTADESVGEPTIMLQHDFSRVDFVPGLKTTLYGHQQTAVMAMLQIEYFRTFEYTQAVHDKKTERDMTKDYHIAYNSAVLSEPPGSGKTIELLALILLSPVPKAMPDLLVNQNNEYATAITVKYKSMFRCTVVLCGASVLRQWLATIRMMTDLRVFCVEDVRDLRRLYRCIENQTMHEYDIILAKNGYITVPVQLPGGQTFGPAETGQRNHICTAIAMAMRHLCVARLIIDDFDTIHLPSSIVLINALMTWFVSATRKKPPTGNPADTTYHNSAIESLTNYHDQTYEIYKNIHMFRLCNVRNDPDHIKNTAKVPYIKYHMIRCLSQDDRAINLLNAFNDRQIMEMVNADAIGEAAQRIGIKSNSVFDVFEKMLGDKFKIFKDAVDHIKFIDFNVANACLRLPLSSHPTPETARYGKRNLQDYDDIEYQYRGIDQLLTECKKEYSDLRDSNGKEIDRVKDNLKHGVCPICTAELDTIDGRIGIIINKCCSATFCGTCGITMQKKGVCSNCRARITANSLIFVGNEIKIHEINEDHMDDDTDTQDQEQSDVVEEKPVEYQSEWESKRAAHIKKMNSRKKQPTKFDALLDVYYGVFDPVYAQRVDMHIPNMMKGACYLPDQPIHKVMVFANFDEAIDKIVKTLKDEKIKFWRLCGTVDEISRIALEFNAAIDNCVLVINSARHCSGLNLQTATDHIFWHRIEDINIESQVIGRGQRLGRKSCLRVWYFCYPNEENSCKVVHNMRPLADEELKIEDQYMDHKLRSTIEQLADGVKRVHDYTLKMRKEQGKRTNIEQDADEQDADEQDADEQDADEQDADEQDANEQDANEQDANEPDADEQDNEPDEQNADSDE